MTTVEKLYQLIPTLTETQLNEVLNFAELLQHKQPSSPSPRSIPPGTLTGLRGIIKRRDIPNDEQQSEISEPNFLLDIADLEHSGSNNISESDEAILKTEIDPIKGWHHKVD